MIGITSYGAYIPRLRLDRMAIFQAMGWFAPALMMVAQGERSMCNWDEDAITMAVAASRDCLRGQDKQKLDAVYLASTTQPFADRQNAGIVSSALFRGSRLRLAGARVQFSGGDQELHGDGGTRRSLSDGDSVEQLHGAWLLPVQPRTVLQRL